jgi:hypothetical protein
VLSLPMAERAAAHEVLGRRGCDLAAQDEHARAVGLGPAVPGSNLIPAWRGFRSRVSRARRICSATSSRSSAPAC